MKNRGHVLGSFREPNESVILDVLQRSGRVDGITAYAKRALVDIIVQEKLYFYSDSLYTTYRYTVYEEHLDQAADILNSDLETLNES